MNTAVSRIITCVPVILLAATFSACGPRTYSVKGKVTLDDKPLPDAQVSFIKKGDPSVFAFGITDSEGNYELKQSRDDEGTMAGEYEVRISTYRGPQEGADDPAPRAPEQVPDKFRTGDEIREVKAGENVFNFDIKTSDGIITQPELDTEEVL